MVPKGDAFEEVQRDFGGSVRLRPLAKYKWMSAGLTLIYVSLFAGSIILLAGSRDTKTSVVAVFGICLWGVMTAIAFVCAYYLTFSIEVSQEGLRATFVATSWKFVWDDVVYIEISGYADTSLKFKLKGGVHRGLDLQFCDERSSDMARLRALMGGLARRQPCHEFAAGPSPLARSATLYLAITLACIGGLVFANGSLDPSIGSALILLGIAFGAVYLIAETQLVSESGVHRQKAFGTERDVRFDSVQRIELFDRLTSQSGRHEYLKLTTERESLLFSSANNDFGGMRDFIIKRCPSARIDDRRSYKLEMS